MSTEKEARALIDTHTHDMTRMPAHIRGQLDNVRRYARGDASSTTDKYIMRSQCRQVRKWADEHATVQTQGIIEAIELLVHIRTMQEAQSSYDPAKIRAQQEQKEHMLNRQRKFKR